MDDKKISVCFDYSKLVNGKNVAQNVHIPKFISTMIEEKKTSFDGNMHLGKFLKKELEKYLHVIHMKCVHAEMKSKVNKRVLTATIDHNTDYYDNMFLKDILDKNVHFTTISKKIMNTIVPPLSYYLKLIGSGWCTEYEDKCFIVQFQDCADWMELNQKQYYREGLRMLNIRKKCTFQWIDFTPMDSFYQNECPDIELRDFKYCISTPIGFIKI